MLMPLVQLSLYYYIIIILYYYYTGKAQNTPLIRAMNIPCISRPRISKLKTNGKNYNSPMMF
jgi:hypothetical protein